MGFGCNAAAVVGCRIIDSRRERIIAMVTNALVPCNGRFPTLIALISMFLVASSSASSDFLSALILASLILLSIFATLLSSKLLSHTLLRGQISSFTLELPPYRRPEIGKTILRSIFDRTLFVLGRAVAVAAPAGLVLWVLANVSVGDASLLRIVADWLDPLGRALGMDGVILLAFLLALPANEIVLPIMLMTYTAGGSLVEPGSLTEVKSVLETNGWTAVTAICVVVFMLFHFPCSTTLMTVKKESGKLRWAILAAVLPTVIGVLLCFLISAVGRQWI